MHRFQKVSIAFVVLGILAPQLVRAEAPIEGGKVFAGPEGVRVEVVLLKPKADNKAIVSVKGSDSEFDGIAQLVDVTNNGNDYTTLFHGRKYAVLVARENWGYRQYALSVPGKRDGLRVAYDEEATKKLKAEDVYALYKKQEGDGTLAALQKFDRKGEEAKHEKQLAELVDRMNAACGAKVVAKIAWASIPDDAVKSLSISSYCGSVLDSARDLCASKAGKDAVSKKVTAYSCQFGTALDLSLKDSTLTYTTFKDAPNQRDFTKAALEKKL